MENYDDGARAREYRVGDAHGRHTYGARGRSRATQAIIESASMRELYRFAARAAVTLAPVLILGETGSGKEMLARFLHEASCRQHMPMRSVSCATISPQLLEATLFGHERGAFTGAVRSATGLFEQANGGTIFLDEVGELTAAAQAALLRVLETGQLSRVGGERELAVDVRVVAATHRSLDTMVELGTFRQDLLYRLNTFTLEVPPLRARREEILPLAQSFLEGAAERWDRPARSLSNDAERCLLGYDWPGNIRQLRNVVDRAVVLCDGAQVLPSHLPACTTVEGGRSAATAVAQGDTAAASAESFALRAALRAHEAWLIQRALQHAEGNRGRAAKLLEIPRRTLTRKLQRLSRGHAERGEPETKTPTET